MQQAKQKATYYQAAHLVVGEQALVSVRSHPELTLHDGETVRTSTVLAIDEMTGNFETKNTIYQKVPV